MNAVAEFVDPDWGEHVNPMPEITLSPNHGSLNSATDVMALWVAVRALLASGQKNRKFLNFYFQIIRLGFSEAILALSENQARLRIR